MRTFRKLAALLTAAAVAATMTIPVSAAAEEVKLTAGAAQKSVSVAQSAGNFSKTYSFSDAENGGIESGSLSITYNDNDAYIKPTNENNTIAENSGSGTSIPFNFTVDPKAPIGSHSLTFAVNYSYKTGGAPTTAVFTLLVSVTAPADGTNYAGLGIYNVTPLSSTVIIGSKSSVSFDLINYGADVSEVDITLSTPTVSSVATKYISAIASGASETVTLDFTAPASTGVTKYTLRISYKGGDSATHFNNAVFDLTATASTPLALYDFVLPQRVYAGQEANISFNIVNTGNEDYTDCQITITSAGRTIAHSYIGTIAAHAQTPATIGFTCDEAKAYSLRMVITYANSAGEDLYIVNQFGVTVSKVSTDADSGALKIQSVSAPLYTNVETATEIGFDITNPTGTSILGAEAFLLDSAGTVLDSVYISELAANSSSPFSLSLTMFSEGKKNYTIKVTYLNSANKTQQMTKQFTITARGAGEDPSGETQKPAKLKIATIDNPSKIYTNVKTEVPYVAVNGGKGDAFNVEVYVLDALGNELARDYIGTIAASSKYEGSIKLKFAEVGDQELTLAFYYENADETNNIITKTFEQKIDQYRITVGEIDGTEYIVEGEQVTVSFSVQNMGAMNLSNVNATIEDQNGTVYGNCYIGGIMPNSKAENQKFKKILFTTESTELFIRVSYENDNADSFEVLSEPQSVYVMSYEEAYGGYDTGWVEPQPGPDSGVEYDEFGNPIVKSEGLPIWSIALIVVGAAAVITVVIIIIVRKKKSNIDSDDMDYFYAQAAPAKTEDKSEDVHQVK